ncbi:hypothetical protein GCM10009850_087420 [Nonomuraea monospora]|uniref:Uncharacterized protein n=1 Tax=Nonomuraea monospora TaxID=568818 RepID=A0ABN3CV01_9ACTN
MEHEGPAARPSRTAKAAARSKADDPPSAGDSDDLRARVSHLEQLLEARGLDLRVENVGNLTINTTAKEGTFAEAQEREENDHATRFRLAAAISVNGL